MIDLLLGSAGNPLLAVEKAVLVELQAALLRSPAQGDIVRLGAGELVHCGAPTRFGNDTQIDLQTRAQRHGRAGVSLEAT